MSCSVVYAGTAPIQPVKKWWYYAKDYGLVGDGTTNETATMRTFLEAAKGKMAVLDSGLTYLIKDSIVVYEGTRFDFSGSTIKFDTSNTKSMIVQGNAEIYGGTVEYDTTVTFISALSGMYGGCMTLGDYGSGSGVSGVYIHDMILSTERLTNPVLAILGGSYNNVVERIHIPNSNGSGLQMHWGGVSGNSPLTDSIQFYPHDNVFRDITIDTLSAYTATGIIMSGGYSNTVENVHILHCGQAIIELTGDFGYFYADTAIYDTSIFRGGYNYFRNVYSLSDSIGLYISSGPSKAPATHPFYKLSSTYENINSIGQETSPGTGIFISQTGGIKIIGGSFSKRNSGYSNGDNVDGVILDGVTWGSNVTGVTASGIYTDSIADNMEIMHCRFIKNSAYGVHVKRNKFISIHDNTFGEFGVDSQSYAIYIADGNHDSIRAAIYNNRIVGANMSNANAGFLRVDTAADGTFGKVVAFYGNISADPDSIPIICGANEAPVDSINFFGHVGFGVPGRVLALRDDSTLRLMVPAKADTQGNGSNLVNLSTGVVLQEGTNIILTHKAGDTVNIAGPASAGTADSLGVDTDGNGTVDNYLYSTVAGAFHLKEGANITFTVTGDTLAIAGPAASGTADSIGVDTDGNGTVDGWMYSTTAGSAHLKEGTGITLTLAGDTTTFATTLGTAIDTTERTASQWEEFVADYAGAMFTGNTETGIAATYEDGDNTVDLVAEVTQAEFDAVCDDSTALKAAKDSVAAWDNGVLAKTADLGPFIDSTSLDTIQNAHKAVLADSTGGGAARSELADSCGGGAARAELADSCAGGAARAELADNVDDTANVVRAEIGDTINTRMVKAVTGNTETGIAVTYVPDDSTMDFVAEVTQAELDAVCDDSTKWNTAYAAYNTYEWHYLTMVHGFNRSLSDSIYLSFPWQTLNSDTLWLLCDSAGNITANDQDTVTISGSVPYACTIDSLEILYRITSGSVIDTVAFRGPDKSTFTNLCDSLYWGSGTDLDQAGATKKCYGFTADVVATAGDRFALKYIVNFAADNNRLNIGWVRIRCKR
jgi:hypothetical protein